MNPISIVTPDFKIRFNDMLFSHGELTVRVGCEKVNFIVAMDVIWWSAVLNAAVSLFVPLIVSRS
jgi:hypothetical protein